ncbi:hypothetical protein GDO86_013304 [Hymenochirus boettgeri]|uniref:Kinase non-catalytic C-lobe domain-containing protein 1 n=1 Tax=Hymenochirus boettgeri TaxID=247094 RepID=A0A8T2IUP6_9PIPI|nr:hypothetical protein GDO86_013304 [Hymenochirus boettgeri]
MEQLSDDPEGAFVPPEFDLTGNTLEAHIYSLGATLKAAIEFVIEPELQTEFCEDLNSLLELMQLEHPNDRPDIESIISLCEAKLSSTSSSMVCRSLSSIGRRVLSIESVSAFQDGWETLWKEMNKKEEGRKLQFTENKSIITDKMNSATSNGEENLNGWRNNGLLLENPCSALLYPSRNDKTRVTTDLCHRESDHIERERTEDERTRPSCMKTLENRHVSGTCSPPGSGKITLKSWPSVPSCASPNESTGEEPIAYDASLNQSNKSFCFVNSKVTDKSVVSCDSMPNHRNSSSHLNHPLCHSHISYEDLVTALAKESQHYLNTDKEVIPELCTAHGDNLNVKHFNAIRQSKTHDHLITTDSEDETPPTKHASSPKLDYTNEVNGSEMSNGDQQWISLKELILKYGKPLNEEQLWALCYECLYTLQTYIDYPAIVCLESMFLDDSGEVLLFSHQNKEPQDALCVPPEYDPQGAGTEKACVYGVAAILWSAAKLNFPSNHKLALPKSLKQFLLHMAKQDADERPTVADALKSNQNAEAALCNRISPEDNSFLKNSEGFVPVSSRSKLTAVKGPVPLRDEKTNLPAAFTSPASYFKPIILTQNKDISSKNKSACSDMEKEDLLEDDISMSDVENQANDKTSQSDKPSNNLPKTHHVNLLESSISDYLSDSKEKFSSGASSSGSSTLTSSPIVNNYILKQDPKTGNLSLVRVHLSVPEHIPSVSLEAEPVSPHAKVWNSPTQTTVPNRSDIQSLNSDALPVPVLFKGEIETKVNDTIGKLSVSDLGLTSVSKGAHRIPNECLDDQSNVHMQDNTNHFVPKRTLSSPLQKVVQLIHDEFAFDGYLENGVEDLAMGEYIFALEGLQFATFCGAIREKFCDLYWDEHLLEKLYKVVSGKSPPLIRRNKADHSDQCNPAHMLKKVQRKSKKHRRQAKMAKNEHLEHPNDLNSEDLLTETSQASEKTGMQPRSQQILTVNTGSEMQEVPGSERDSSIGEADLTDILKGSVGKKHQLQTSRTTANIEDHYLFNTFTDGNNCCLSPNFPDENEENIEDSLLNHRDNNSAMSISPSELYKCSTGWSSAFYGSQLFNAEVQHYVNTLGRQNEGFSKSIYTKRLELEQQLVIETKNYRKTIKLYQRCLLKGKRNKGSEVKELLAKLKGHLEEMKSKVQFLELAKKLLQVSYAEQWGIESHLLSTVANLTTQRDNVSSPEASFLLMYNQKGHPHDRNAKGLQAGTPLGLMTQLYSRNAFLDGYVQQFLYIFRYFCSQEDLLQFLIDRINSTASSSEETDYSCVDRKIFHRSLILLQTWIESCCHVDFSRNPELLDRLEDLSNGQIFLNDECCDYLLSLLREVSTKKYTISSPVYKCGDKKDDTKSLHSLCTKLSEDNVSRKSFNWKLSKGNGLTETHENDKHYTIVSALPRPCYAASSEHFSLAYIKPDETGIYSIRDCSVQQISLQLTLIQEEMFQKCHPIHFLNSRALGVTDKSNIVPKNVCVESPPVEICSLFVANCTQDKYLLQMIKFAENVSTWVSAEIVTCHTSKLQITVLTKFLLVAKLSYEQRDFASAIQILGGLENLIVRQLPAWKNLPSKVANILEELKAVEVFLKSDSLCLTKGDRFRTLPTIPSACLLAMHVQQLETGGFTMASGAFKWNKLRNIAKVVSQVQAFQEIPYSFTPEPELQFYLQQRIAHFRDADISILAANNNANFYPVPSHKHSRKIQDTFRRMKATFQ